jgi:hypothetical protein
VRPQLAARLVACLAAPLALAACATTAAPPRAPPGVDPAHLHFTVPEARVGEPAPDFTLPLAGRPGSVTLADFRGRPLVLVFGSFTWGPFRNEVGDLALTARTYRDQVAFLMVYVREAHASDEWVMGSNTRLGIELPQPLTDAERRAVAAQFVEAQGGLPFPVAVDGVDDRVGRAYGAWPERLYVLDAEGRVAWQGGYGPFEFDADGMRAFVERTYGPPARRWARWAHLHHRLGNTDFTPQPGTLCSGAGPRRRAWQG